MAVKRAPAKKTAAKKAPAKRAPAKKAPAPRGAEAASVGDIYSCEVCGLAVRVDETCGCAEACDLICCGTPMQRGARI